ncbi:MAG: imidazole glycerol phosphate synthase cyclase subunit [Patescibacteria group bacterium]
MITIRVIPQLHIKGSKVVKPVHTEALRVVGDPTELAARYYTEGADELIYLDVVASLYERNLDLSLVQAVADKIYIPLTVGGGIRSIHDISNALRAGADKVAINTQATKNPWLLKEAAEKFGSQCIVLFVEAKSTGSNTWEVLTDGGRERARRDVIEWVKQALDLGVGEVLLTSVDRDGTNRGYDLELISVISSFATVPVIAHGGAGNLATFQAAIKTGRADAVAASSVFHYQQLTLRQVKDGLKRNGINVRL